MTENNQPSSVRRRLLTLPLALAVALSLAGIAAAGQASASDRAVTPVITQAGGPPSAGPGVMPKNPPAFKTRSGREERIQAPRRVAPRRVARAVTLSATWQGQADCQYGHIAVPKPSAATRFVGGAGGTERIYWTTTLQRWNQSQGRWVSIVSNPWRAGTIYGSLGNGIVTTSAPGYDVYQRGYYRAIGWVYWPSVAKYHGTYLKASTWTSGGGLPHYEIANYCSY